MARLRALSQLALFMALLVLAVVVLILMLRPRWTVERVYDVVVTTLQQETPASELVTGRVGVTASREIRDRGRFSWIPDWMGVPGVNIVGAGVRVEVVGDALYGFDVRGITPEMIRVGDGGVIEIELPPLQIIAVEPDLGRLELRSREGLLRRGAARPLEAEALEDVHQALREQGRVHLGQSMQPAINSGRALAAALRPAFEAAGMHDPRFRFRLDDELLLEPRREPADEPVSQRSR